MQFTPPLKKRKKCPVKDIQPGDCFMKALGYTVYMLMADRASTGSYKAVNLENGKLTSLKPDDDVFPLKAELTWSFHEVPA